MFHSHTRRSRVPAAMVAALIIAETARLAAQQPAPTTTFTAKLGFVNTAGNSRQTTLNFGEKLTQAIDALTLTQELQGIYSRNDTTTISNFLSAALRAQYTMTPRLATQAYAAWERDVPAGLTQRLEEGVAFAYQAPTDPKDTFSISLGPTLVQERRVGLPDHSYAAGRAAIDYRHHFTSKATFVQLLEYLPDLQQSADYRFNTDTGLSAPLAGHLALDISYRVRYTNIPPPGRIRADRFLTTGFQLTL
jgi:putative salt-induced outer membrane protein YdiY